MTVYVKDSNVAAALRTHKKKLVKDHRIAELKRHDEYEKPSEARRRKVRQSAKRRAKAARHAAQQASHPINGADWPTASEPGRRRGGAGKP